MRQRFTSLILIAALLTAGLAMLSGPRAVLGQDPTIPTRTPTPDPNAPPTAQPTVPPPPTNTPVPGGSQPTAEPPPSDPATAVPVATDVAPAAATATIAAIPAAATNEPATAPTSTTICDDRPYATTTEQTNVLAGPGDDYAAIFVLQADETRLMTGRAQFGAWWLIQVNDSMLGWVADDSVEESGNVGSLPLVDAPVLNGATPTPGAAWEPTPVAYVPCEPTDAAPETPATAPAKAEATTVPATPEPTPTKTILVVATISSAPNEAAGVSNTLPDEEPVAAAAAPAAQSPGAPLSQFALPALGVILVASGIGLAVFGRKPPTVGKE